MDSDLTEVAQEAHPESGLPGSQPCRLVTDVHVSGRHHYWAITMLCCGWFPICTVCVDHYPCSICGIRVVIAYSCLVKF